MKRTIIRYPAPFRVFVVVRVRFLAGTIDVGFGPAPRRGRQRLELRLEVETEDGLRVSLVCY